MGPERAHVLPASPLSLGGNTQLGWGQPAASEAQAWGGHPRTPKGGEPGGASPGLIRMPGLSSKGTLEAVPSHVN